MSSLIRGEIQQFASFANVFHWFDELHGCFRPLHSFNQLRIPWLSAHLATSSLSAVHLPLSGKQILDVGCGAGILSTSLCRRGALVTGLDADESVLEIANGYKETMAPGLRKKIEFIPGTIERLAQEKDRIGTFDAVVSSEVVEHVSDLPLFIRSCCKLARPNSPIFFTTINRTIWSQLLAKTIAEVFSFIFFLLFMLRICSGYCLKGCINSNNLLLRATCANCYWTSSAALGRCLE
ncbi:hypothetical protein niasHS_017536 [Heterodera schachtii]|uniref:Methyltransferase type 11 domain-containing protein n=1 Tax=Heterodera schachtii TaxID=97005 RepID=A0ABD2HXC9_HETSC